MTRAQSRETLIGTRDRDWAAQGPTSKPAGRRRHTGQMRLLEPVVETFNVIGFAAWPVTEPTPDRRLRLSGGMSAEDVGAAIAVMVPQHLLETHNHPGQAPDLIRSLTR